MQRAVRVLVPSHLCARPYYKPPKQPETSHARDHDALFVCQTLTTLRDRIWKEKYNPK